MNHKQGKILYNFKSNYKNKQKYLTLLDNNSYLSYQKRNFYKWEHAEKGMLKGPVPFERNINFEMHNYVTFIYI